jgi:hypothetical protein
MLSKQLTILHSHLILEDFHSNQSILNLAGAQAPKVRVVEELDGLFHQKLNPTAAHYRCLRVKGYGLH